MFNKYQIDLIEADGHVKAGIYIEEKGKWKSLGWQWKPSNKLNTKEDFVDLFQAIGNTIYGQENKAKKKELQEEKSLRETLTLIQAKNSSKQKEK